MILGQREIKGVNAIIFHNIVNYRILFKIKLLVLDCVEILKGKSLILKQKNWETLCASLIIHYITSWQKRGARNLRSNNCKSSGTTS
ncbi:hypothetical protein COY61_01540 [bacterium (Candidatus Gribaldobacteria) CG_4_10_14_0_8_um_filter_33_9]|uniref:Uncharacterized protein n=1 Tax=bacterium (Candidatus Gribaldobacteria) CG_4_10_14_0_8_um_filter_33_9 TaxID=2014266 RepID=A0A2M7RMU9_9BACT|nr:MAG: hypothetical protein COY61_01540 [bacterium (Candidatus Gribaldobacteria) CG_4_10_14_0_8_um_filter_33_9]